MAGVFISYRRDDATIYAKFLAQILRSYYSEHDVFLDVSSIDPGADFAAVIRDTLDSCNALVAVIGKNWLTAPDDAGNRRIDNPKDFVRTEIAEALKRNIMVVPAIVQGAQMPRADELPNDLGALASRNNIVLNDTTWHEDVEWLIGVLDRAVPTNTTIIQRVDGPNTHPEPLQVWVDSYGDTPALTINPNDTKALDIPAGFHTLWVELGEGSLESEKLSVYVRRGEQTFLFCGLGRGIGYGGDGTTAPGMSAQVTFIFLTRLK